MWRAGATLHCGARASHCGGFPCCGAWAIGTQASVVVARGLSSCGSWALECRLSSCGSRAQLLRSMWDLPGPGLEPVSLALAGGFFTTAPPGKPQMPFFSSVPPWAIPRSQLGGQGAGRRKLWALREAASLQVAAGRRRAGCWELLRLHPGAPDKAPGPALQITFSFALVIKTK